MVLQLCSDHLQIISTHADRTYPEECCGLLIGQLQQRDHSDYKTLVEVWATENAWSAEVEESMRVIVPQPVSQSYTKARRYQVDPKNLLKGQRYARDRGLQVIGIYHSHPDSPATPSECDRACAWSRYSYMIVSVQQGSTQDFCCWSLDENQQFQPEEIIVMPAKT